MPSEGQDPSCGDTLLRTVDAWAEFRQIALERARDREEVTAAIAFVAFKARAVRTVVAEIKKHLPDFGHVEIEQEPAGESLSQVSMTQPTLNEQVQFKLYLLFDTYLFEATGLEDAVLQLINVSFGFGIPERNVSLKSIRQHLQRLSANGSTPLDEWISLRTGPNPWLSWLTELRNRATHRRLLRMGMFLPPITVGGDSPTTGRVPIQLRIPTADRQEEPLLDFLDRMAQNFDALLPSTFQRLADLLVKRP